MFLFWLHVFVIVAAITTGFFLSFPFVALLIILHRIHLHIFGDCILTSVQRSRDTLVSNENFLQEAARRLFSIDLSVQGSTYVTYGIYATTMCASLSRVLFIS